MKTSYKKVINASSHGNISVQYNMYPLVFSLFSLFVRNTCYHLHIYLLIE